MNDVSKAHKCNTFIIYIWDVINMNTNYKLMDVNVGDVTGFFFERSSYDETDLKQMGNNIKESGQINDIILRHKGDNGDLQGIAGSRRFKSFELSGINTFKAKVFDNMSDIEALNICLSENIHTKDMSSIDIAKLLKQWIDTGTKSSEIALQLGKSSSWVSKQLKLLDTDESTQNAISAGDITAEHARAISILPNAKDRDVMLKKATDGDLSVTATKQEIDKKISRMDVTDKIDKLNSSIVEYEQKIIDADNSIKQIEDFEKRLAELDIERKKLNSKLTDELIRQKAFSISIVYEKIRPLETSISSIESEIEVLNNERDKISLDAVEKQYTIQSKKVSTASNKVEKLQKLLTEAKDQHKAELTTLKPLQTSISDHQSLTKKITDKTQSKNQKSKGLEDMIKANKEAYNNYDTLVTEVNSFNDESKQISAITQEYADISAQIPSLRGKVSNKTRYEGILERNKSELVKMEILDKN